MPGAGRAESTRHGSDLAAGSNATEGATRAAEVQQGHDDTTSANPDSEMLAAIRPTLATTGGPLICISSPYRRSGALWESYRDNFGPAGDPKILVAQAASRDMNPSLPQSVVDRALEKDAAEGAAEYLAQFRTDLESFIQAEAVQRCVDAGVYERPYDRQHSYRGFVDPSGGSNDSFVLAISHKENQTSVIDVIRERKAPCEPQNVVEEFSHVLRQYHVNTIEGDHYAGEWPVAAFRQFHITYEVSKLSKSEIYRDALPLINGRKAALLDNKTLQRQLVALERRTSRGGRDSIDHPPGAKDDVANAVCGGLLLAAKGLTSAEGANFLRPIIYPKVRYA